MKDTSKTKKQLIEELNMLRWELACFAPADTDQLNKNNDICELEGKLSAVLRHSPVSIAVARLADRKIIEVSDSFLLNSGYVREEVIGQTAIGLRLIDEDQLTIINKTFTEQGCIHNAEIKYRRKNGELCYGLFSAAAVNISGVPHLLTEIIDITEKKNTAEMLQSSAAEISDLYNNAPCGYHSLAADGTFLRINDTELNWLGYARDEIIGKKKLTDILTADSIKIFENSFPLLKERGFNNNLEMEMVRRDGTILPVLLNATVMSDAAGNFIMTRSTITDNNERRKYNNALIASEEKFNKAFHSSPVSMVITAIDEGRLIDANESYLKSVGYKRHEIIGRTLKELNLYNDYSQRDYVVKIISEKGYVHNLDILIRTKAGDIRHGVFDIQTIETGGEKYLLSVVNDITESKKAEESLRASEERFRTIFKEVPLGMFLSDANGLFFQTNSFFRDMLGYTQEEIALISFKDITHPDYLENDIEHVKKIFSGEENIYKTEKRYWKKNREIIWGALTLTAIRNAAGDFLYFLGMIEDITVRKKAEESLRASEERYRKIYENAAEGIFQSTPAGRFISVNPALAKICGYDSPAEMINAITNIAVQYFVIPEERKIIINLMEENGFFRNVEYQVYRKDGSKVWISVNGRAVRDSGGTIILYEGTCVDITWRKEAEEERRRLEELLRRSEKMEALGKLAGGVAHDLNNILGVLVGYSELLLMEISENHPLRRHVNNILQSGERAAAIIQDLLTLARRGVAVSEIINLNNLINDYLQTPEFVSVKSYYSHVGIKTSLEQNLMNIKGSPVHIIKSLMNLINNATESISGQGEVSITTENVYLDKPVHGYEEMKAGEYVLLKVTDTGKGIAAKDISKIFEPFYTKKVMGRSGTGLGLAVVWGTVKDHKGYIDVQSEEGKGSVFTLYFPAIRQSLAENKHFDQISPDIYRGKGESILIVDDIPEQRELATRMLQKLGYHTQSVSGGEDAMEHVRNNKVDLVLLDMIMEPGIDGLETYKRICAIKPGQKAIIVSGFSETDRVRNAQQLGAGAYVRKPYIMEKIGLAIRQELDKN